MSVEQLFNDFHRELYFFIYRRVDCDQEAEDIMQTVFLKVLKKADMLHEVQYMWSWLSTIAERTIIDYYRKHKHKVYNDRLEEPNISKEIELCLKLDGLDESLYHCLHALIAKLPEKDRYIVESVGIKGIKQVDLAEELEMNYQTLRSKYQRIVKKLIEWKEKCLHSTTYCSVLNTIDRSACAICGKNFGSCSPSIS